MSKFDRRRVRSARTPDPRLSTAALAVGVVATHVVVARAEAARPLTKHLVEVWVAAVPVTWNVVPNGHDAIEHMDFDPCRDDLPHGRLPRVHA